MHAQRRDSGKEAESLRLKADRQDIQADGPLQKVPLPALLVMYCAVSTGMMVFNKISLTVLPPLSLVGIQAAFAVFAMACLPIELGSFSDQKRFMVVPAFFCGMLLFSALTLHKHSLTFLIVFRSCTPICSLAMERCVFSVSKVRAITPLMVVALVGAVMGAVLYVWSDFSSDNMSMKVLAFCTANMVMASGDRIANRWVTAERPVRMNNEGMVLINNFFTAIFCLGLAVKLGEMQHVQVAFTGMTLREGCVVLLGCIAGAALGIFAFAVQRRITATDMQVLINANKIGVVFFEVLFMGKVLAGLAFYGCVLALCSGALYSHAVTKRSTEERKTLLDKEKGKP